jgi:hypothetical protein
MTVFPEKIEEEEISRGMGHVPSGLILHVLKVNTGILSPTSTVYIAHEQVGRRKLQ